MSSDKKELTKKHFANHAKTYDKKLGSFASSLYEPILSMARGVRARKVLDIGCGTGNILKLIWEEEPDAVYYGIDLSPAMLSQAEDKLKDGIRKRQVLLSEGDAENLPFKKKTMDLIICNASFHHYPNPGRALLEMHRVLERGGHLIIGDPCPSRFMAPLKNKFKKHRSEYHIYTKSEFKRILKMAGFKVLKFEKPTRGRCVILAKKKETGGLSLKDLFK